MPSSPALRRPFVSCALLPARARGARAAALFLLGCFLAPPACGGSGGGGGTGGTMTATGGASATGGQNTGGAGGTGGGATGGNGTGGNGTGGSATGGARTGGASAGGSATGGSATGGTTTGGVGGGATGGAAGSAGRGGNVASTGGTGQGGGAPSSDCGALPLCDSFEGTAAGAAPNAALWTLIPSQNTGTATVDGTMGAHGSTHSLKVVGTDRLYLRNSTVIGTLGAVVHVRFYVRFNAALPQNHGAMIVTHPMMVDQYSQQNELRFGSQDNVFHWNTDSDAANVPDVGPGDALSFKPVANTWYCVELTIDTGTGNLATSIDGNDIAGLKVDGTPTANIDQSWLSGTTSRQRYMKVADFNFGWQSYGAGPMTLWYDDIALSASPIGCAK